MWCLKRGLVRIPDTAHIWGKFEAKTSKGRLKSEALRYMKFQNLHFRWSFKDLTLRRYRNFEPWECIQIYFKHKFYNRSERNLTKNIISIFRHVFSRISLSFYWKLWHTRHVNKVLPMSYIWWGCNNRTTPVKLTIFFCF